MFFYFIITVFFSFHPEIPQGVRQDVKFPSVTSFLLPSLVPRQCGNAVDFIREYCGFISSLLIVIVIVVIIIIIIIIIVLIVLMMMLTIIIIIALPHTATALLSRISILITFS